MGESTSDLLTKVETALWLGDQRLAGMLLHKVLTQDFTNRQAWFLLHSMRGEGQTLEDFQHSFAAKYYPHLAYLLDGSPADFPAHTEAAAPDSLPLASFPIEINKFCAVCGTALLPQAKFCPYCGAPVTQAEQPSAETPISPELPEAAQTAVDLSAKTPETTEATEPEHAGLEPRTVFPEAWAGAYEPADDTPEPHQEAYEPLPEELDLLFKRATRLAPEAPAGASTAAKDEPETDERRPYCPACHKIFPPETLFCDSCGAPLFQMVNRLPTEPNPAPEQTAGQDSSAMEAEQLGPEMITSDLPANGTPAEINRPEPKGITTRTAAGTKTKEHRLPLGLKILLLALLFLIFMVGIGMIVLFLINQGVL